MNRDLLMSANNLIDSFHRWRFPVRARSIASRSGAQDLRAAVAFSTEIASGGTGRHQILMHCNSGSKTQKSPIHRKNKSFSGDSPLTFVGVTSTFFC